jgi:hypothetical protein
MKVWRELALAHETLCCPGNFLDKVVLSHDSDKVAGKQVVLLLFPYITISLDVPVYLWRERCVKVCSDMTREMISVLEQDIFVPQLYQASEASTSGHSLIRFSCRM